MSSLERRGGLKAELLDAGDVAALLHTSYSTAVRMMRSGELSARKVAGKWLVSKGAVIRDMGIDMGASADAE